MKRGEEGHQRRAHHDEVEMSDDEVSVVPVGVEGHGGERDARHPAEDQEEDEAADVGVGRRERDGALVHRANPGEGLDGGEDADEHRRRPEEAGVEGRLARDEEVVSPGEEPDEGDPQRRVDDWPVTEGVLAREAAHHFAYHPHGGEDGDVDGGVGVEPEEVLHQQRIAAHRRVEEANVKRVLDGHEQERQAEDGRGDHLDDAGGVDRPHEEREPHPGEPGRAQGVDRDDEVDPRGHAGEADDEETEEDRDHRGRRRGAVGSVKGPAGVGAAVDHRGEDDHRAGEVEIEPEEVEPRKATSRAPIISGTMKLPKALGIAGTRKRRSSRSRGA